MTARVIIVATGQTGPTTPATGIALTDAGGYFTSGHVEGALQEEAAARVAHAAAADPHPGYLTPAEGNAAYDALGATGVEAVLRAAADAAEVTARNSAIAAQHTADISLFVPVFNPVFYGATANGTTNDGTAIASAISAASAAGGGVVYFPAGTFAVTTTIVLPSNVALVGAGRRDSFLTLAAAAANSTSIVTTTSTDKTQIRDLGFKGASKAGAAINTVTATDCLIERCWFDATSGWAVFCNTSSKYVRLVNSIIEGTRTSNGMEVNNSSYCGMVNCHVKGATSAGFEDYYNQSGESVGNYALGNTIESCVNGINSHGATSALYNNNVIRNCSNYGLNGTNGEYITTKYGEFCQAVGNSFIACASAGMLLNDSTRGWTVSGDATGTTAGPGWYLSGDAHQVSVTATNCYAEGVLVYSGSSRLTLLATVTDCSNISIGGRAGINNQGTYSRLLGCTVRDTRGTKRHSYGIQSSGADVVMIGGHAMQASARSSRSSSQAFDLRWSATSKSSTPQPLAS